MSKIRTKTMKWFWLSITFFEPKLTKISRFRHLPSSRRPCRPFRYQGSGDFIHCRRRGRENPEVGPGALRGDRHRAARGDRHLYLHWRTIICDTPIRKSGSIFRKFPIVSREKVHFDWNTKSNLFLKRNHPHLDAMQYRLRKFRFSLLGPEMSVS